MSFLVLALLGCNAGGPVSEPKTAEPRETPWRIDYYDGSGNSYRFDQPSDADPVGASYDPVDPIQSSSGEYDGGDPWTSQLDEDETGELWRWVDGLVVDTSVHAERREKGTGLVRVRGPGGDQSYLIARGTQLSAFETFLPSLK